VSVQRVYLVIDADRNVRVMKRPRIGMNEIAVAINLTYPSVWGRVVSTLDVNVPDFTPDIEIDDDGDGEE
jgi:hypothetical protein